MSALYYRSRLDGVWTLLTFLLVALLASCGSERDEQSKVAQKRQSATIDLDESYVVMGRRSVLLQNRVTVLSGNVGVNAERGSYPGLQNPCIRRRSTGLDYTACYPGSWGVALQVQDATRANPGTKLVGDTVRIGRAVSVAEVFYGAALTADATVQTSARTQVSEAYFPLFPALPTMPMSAPGADSEGQGAADVTLSPNESRCFSSGSYGDFVLRPNATLRFAADCNNPASTAAASFRLGDISAQPGARITFGPGVVHMRNLQVPIRGEVQFLGPETHVRDLKVEAQGRLVFAAGEHHVRNLRTESQAALQFTAADEQRTRIVVQNRLIVGNQNEINASAYGSSTAPGRDPRYVLFYVLGHDGRDARDDASLPTSQGETPVRPYAAQVGAATMLRANIIALDPAGVAVSSLHIQASSVAVGSYFADNVLIGDNVSLTNRNGLVGVGGASPAYLEGDVDNDGVLDATDRCRTVADPEQLDRDADGFGDACDNCPTTANPRQERAYPNHPSDRTGAACVAPPLPYCGDGIAQLDNDEECDLGFSLAGPEASCTRNCRSNLPRIVSQPTSVTVLEGASATFSVGAHGVALSYAWQRDGVEIPGANLPSYVLERAQHGDDGARFRCIVSNAAGSVISAEAILTVQKSAPVITQQPADQLVREGEPATFVVAAHGADLTYQWYRGTVAIQGARESSYTVSNTTLADDGAVLRVAVSNAGGSVLSEPARLFVRPAAPRITTELLDQTVLERERVVLAVTAAGQNLRYAWRKDGVTRAAETTASLIIDSAQRSHAGRYQVVVSNDGGSVTSREAVITVQLAPPRLLSEPSDAAAPEGGAATFSVRALGSELAYQWQRGGVDIAGATAEELTLGQLSLADDGATFAVRVANAAGTVVSRAATLRVSALAPAIASHPADTEVVEGESATFAVAATGSALHYQWQKNGADLAGATGASYTVSRANADEDGALFRCRVSNAAGTATTHEARLTVRLRAPTLSSQPSDLTVREGQTATFAVTAAGTRLSYQWRRDGVDIPGATADRYSVAEVRAQDHAATFAVVVSNTAGSVVSRAARLDVELLLPNILVSPGAQTVTEGQDVRFAVEASGTALRYAWQRDGEPIAGASEAVLTLRSVRPEDDGASFRVVVSNDAGSVTSSAAVLHVRLAAPVIARQPQSLSVDEGAPAHFTVEAQGTNLTYQWQRNGVAIAGANSASYTLVAAALVDHEAQYRCVVANSAATLTSQAAVLSVRQLPPTIASEPSDQSVTEGEPVSFSVTARGSELTYRWQRDGQDLSGATGSTYALAAVGAEDDGALFRVLIQNPTGTVMSREARLSVALRPPRITSGPADLTVSEGSVATFSVAAVGTRLSYQWQRDGSALAGATAASVTVPRAELSDHGARFSVTVTNGAGSIESRIAELRVTMLPPTVVSQPLATTVQEGQDARFEVTASGSALTYQWLHGTTAIAGATERTYTLTGATLEDHGASFRVRVENAAGAVTSDSAALSVQQLPPRMISEPSDQTTAESGSVRFAAAVSGSRLTYQWSKNGVAIAGATSDTLAIERALLSDDGARFQLHARNAAGEVRSREALLSVRQNAPRIVTHPTDLTIAEGGEARFAVTAEGSGLRYQWQRDDVDLPGETGSELVLRQVAYAPADARFRVLVSNAAGVATSDSAVLHVTLLAPTVTEHPAGVDVLEGEPADFRVAARGTLATYQWLRNGAAIAGANAATYRIEATALADDGARFSCRIENPAGSIVSDAAALTVRMAPPVLLAQPQAATVHEGESASFAVAARGTALRYRWQRNGVDIAGATAASYSIARAALADDGALFRVLVANDAGSVSSEPALLTVRMVAPVIVSSPASRSVLVGADVSFACEARGSALRYRWQRDGVDIQGADAAAYTFSDATLSDSGASFRCMVANDAGSAASTAALLTVVECFEDGFKPTTTSCGVGGCRTTGKTSCVNGRIADSCVAGAPASSDASCDGIDQDCNGESDEDYVTGTIQCGVGVCMASGSRVCSNGREQDACTPAQPQPNDASCNGLDDDCSGQADEDYTATCSGTLASRCVSGQIQIEQCSDGDACNGVEQCAAGSCSAGPAPEVDDRNACTEDACTPANGVSHVPYAAGTSCGGTNECDDQARCLAVTTPVIDTHPVDVSVDPGAMANFSVVARGTNIRYQWLRLGEVISGATEANYSFGPVVRSDHEKQFSVRVTNSAGAVTSNPAVVRVVDAQGPVITLADLPPTLSADFVVLTGTAVDADGVEKLTVSNGRLGGQAFGALLEGDAFRVEVPLELGQNGLTLTAVDKTGRSGVLTLVVTSEASTEARVSILTPVSGTKTSSAVIDVTGRVRASVPASQVRLVLGNQVTFPTGAGEEYSFTFHGVPLVTGANVLTVRAETVYGATTAQTIVLRDAPSTTPTEPAPPRISVQATGSEVYVASTTVPVAGTVIATRCVSSVSVNGAPARITGSGAAVSFDATLSFPTTLDSMQVVVAARDCDARSAQLAYTVRRDTVGPTIELAGVLLDPAVNRVTETPFVVSGLVRERNLAGFSANEQSIGLFPAGDGVYSFRFDVPLVHGSPVPIRLEAWDFAGQRSQASLTVALDGELRVDILAPSEGAKFLSEGTSGELEVAARIVGVDPASTVTAQIDNGTAVGLALYGDIARGVLQAGAGDHTLSVRVQDAAGQQLAGATRRFSVSELAAQPLELVSADPNNGASGREGNTSITVRFSKPIADPLQLTFKVYETVHGVSYEATPSGGMGAVLPAAKRIDRDRELVLGNLTVLPGNDSASFEPVREFAFGALVDAEVLYDDAALGKLQFRVRPPPTLATGSVFDAAGEPASGVEVELVELARTTLTDEEGAFSFGFAESVERDLPAGAYSLRINGKGKALDYGSLERRVRLEAARLNGLGLMRLPRIARNAAPRLVRSGADDVSFDDGRLRLDLSQATVRGADGLSEATVHIAPYRFADTSIASAALGAPSFLYVAHPVGVVMGGDAGVEMSIPAVDGSHGYLDHVGARAVILGRSPETLELVPVGVGVLDRTQHRLRSERAVALRRLDALGYLLMPPSSQALLERYGRGEISLEQLARELGTGAP